VLVQDCYRVHAKRTKGSEIVLDAPDGTPRRRGSTKTLHGLRRTYHRLKNRFWRHSMVLLGDEAQLEACFGPSRDSAKLDARLVHGLHRTYRRLEYLFGCTG
jgi:hypothetical protein